MPLTAYQQTLADSGPDATRAVELVVTARSPDAKLGRVSQNVVWNHVDSGSPPLHRPTIADAEDYPYYRPRPETDAPWGLTEPLRPNPDGIQPQPEVVMPETTSQGLRLPFRVVQA